MIYQQYNFFAFVILISFLKNIQIISNNYTKEIIN